MSARTLEYEAIQVGRVLVFAPVIPDDAPDAVREGLVRRRLMATGQPCPCGAVRPEITELQVLRQRLLGEEIRLAVHHEDDCPATDEAIVRALRRWSM